MTVDIRQLPAIDAKPRCWRCKRVLAVSVARPWEIQCGRCKAKNASAA